jgi:hypothetical protein
VPVDRASARLGQSRSILTADWEFALNFGC